MDGVSVLETTLPDQFIGHSFNFVYTASSSSALLSLFSQLNGTGISYGIDNISIQTVPEPSSLWLMGVGGIATARFFRNHRKRLL